MRRPPSPSLHELLSAERPARPLPKPTGARLRALVAAPTPYPIAMGGLNLQAVWESLLGTGRVTCDRAFSNWPDGAPLLSSVQLASYDLVGLSLPYELDWLALPAMLAAGGLPAWARERSDDAPLILAGGASVTMNPEPLAEIVDAFVIGEAEPALPAITETLAATPSRSERLAALAELPGVYVPSQPRAGPVQRLIWDGATNSPRTSAILSPHAAFPDRFLIETGRGCPMGCRFCLACSIYRPVRYATPDSLLAAATEGLKTTRRIGLIGAALSGLPGLTELVADLVNQGADVSLSSLRADRLTPELLAALKRGGQDVATIAPEAGTEALRSAVGKPIPDATLDAAIAAVSEASLREVKLYFMTNLPGEVPTDREAIVSLVASWVTRFPKLRFAVTVSPFVPKPWTPFENAPFPAVPQVRRALTTLAGRLRLKAHVEVRPGSARWAAVQTALARGDRRTGRAIVAAAAKGGGYSALKTALKAEGVDPDAPQYAPEVTPWRQALAIAEVSGSVGAEGEADE